MVLSDTLQCVVVIGIIISYNHDTCFFAEIATLSTN